MKIKTTIFLLLAMSSQAFAGPTSTVNTSDWKWCSSCKAYIRTGEQQKTDIQNTTDPHQVKPGKALLSNDTKLEGQTQ